MTNNVIFTLNSVLKILVCRFKCPDQKVYSKEKSDFWFKIECWRPTGGLDERGLWDFSTRCVRSKGKDGAVDGIHS